MIPKPPIITREQSGLQRVDCQLYEANEIAGLARIYNRITVHHDATVAPAMMTQAEACQRWRDHQAQHLGQGWSDIGYHYGIDPAGRIYSGRTMFAPGAHVHKANTGNLGICLMGRFDQQPVPGPALRSLIDLAAWACSVLEVAPEAIAGHRDYLATECPGSALYSRLAVVRGAVRGRLRQ